MHNLSTAITTTLSNASNTNTTSSKHSYNEHNSLDVGTIFGMISIPVIITIIIAYFFYNPRYIKKHKEKQEKVTDNTDNKPLIQRSTIDNEASFSNQQNVNMQPSCSGEQSYEVEDDPNCPNNRINSYRSYEGLDGGIYEVNDIDDALCKIKSSANQKSISLLSSEEEQKSISNARSSESIKSSATQKSISLLCSEEEQASINNARSSESITSSANQKSISLLSSEEEQASINNARSSESIVSYVRLSMPSLSYEEEQASINNTRSSESIVSYVRQASINSK